MVLDTEVEMVSDPYTFADEDQLRVILAEDAQGNPGLGYLSLASIGRRVEAMGGIQTATGFELNLSGFGSWFGLVSALWQLKYGRPLITLGPLDIRSLEKFAPLPIESISGSPVEVSSAAVVLSESDVAFKSLHTLVMAGSALTGDFYLHIRGSLDVEFVNVLGDPTLGFTFVNLPLPNHQIQDLGKLVDGVKAKITDSQDRPTVPGDVGNLSLKSAFVGLDANSNSNATSTEGEYLSTGKKAVFQAGRYRLTNQEFSWTDICSDSLIAREIEAFALEIPGVTEAAVVKAFGALGEPVVALALNAPEEHILRDIFGEIKRVFPDSNLSHVLRIRFIPRDVAGEPLTQELARFVSAQLVDLESQSDSA
jgi:acyl-CoA synthetase (AMP-forming)/AMP-acid ligase II